MGRYYKFWWNLLQITAGETHSRHSTHSRPGVGFFLSFCELSINILNKHAMQWNICLRESRCHSLRKNFLKKLWLEREFKITIWNTGIKNTETYMYNKKVIVTLLRKSKKKKKQIWKFRWKKPVMDKIFFLENNKTVAFW